jgi:hypothetical protein
MSEFCETEEMEKLMKNLSKTRVTFGRGAPQESIKPAPESELLHLIPGYQKSWLIVDHLLQMPG